MAVEVDRSPRQRGVSLVERNKQAALERQANIEKAQAEAAAQAEAERKNDGRQYDMEVEGFNIGDSLVRRAVAASEKVARLQEEMFEEDINATDDEIENEIPVVSNNEDIEEELYDEDDDFIVESYKHVVDVDNEFIEKEETVEEEPEETIEEVEEIEESEPTVEDEKSSPVIDTEKVVSLPTNQSEIKIDEKDFNDIDIAAEIEADVEGEDDTVQIEDERVSKEEMEKLKTAIKKKVVKLPDISNMAVSKKPVSVNQVVSSQSISRVVDWPLMESGKLITMRSFSGPEMDDLIRDLEKETTRNRANIRRENLKLIYDHLTSPKPSFDKWLRTELVDDYSSYEMAAMVASYNGANYTPMSCTDPNCNNIWLTDNIPMKKHMKFNSKEAENRFNQIMTAPDTVKASPRLKRVPISESLAVDIRVKLSFYTAFFENSILDPKFSSKYSKLLDLIMYIDEMYEIKSDGLLHKVIYKIDNNSEVKTLKYRIASYAKIIANLSSDAYTRLYVEIRDTLQDASTDYITYVMPEVTCPKCGRVIEATEVGSRPYSLVLARHRLTQLTAKL